VFDRAFNVDLLFLAILGPALALLEAELNLFAK